MVAVGVFVTYNHMSRMDRLETSFEDKRIQFVLEITLISVEFMRFNKVSSHRHVSQLGCNMYKKQMTSP